MNFLGVLAGVIAASLTVFAPPARAELSLDARLGQGVIIPGKTDKLYLRLALKGLAGPRKEKRTPLNVSVVIDRSGSMAGERIARAKEAAIMVLERLGADDIVSVVTYDHNVDVLVPPARLRDQEAVAQRIRSLQPGGRTALHAGVTKGLEQVRSQKSAGRINRVILLSDGLANVGPSSPADLEALGRSAGTEGISVSTIGLGTGYNEDLMTRLALASDGNHAFARQPHDLLRIFDSEFGDALGAVAQDITIEIIIREGCRPVRVLGRMAEISGNTVRLRMSQLAATQEKYVVIELDAPSSAAATVAEIAHVRVGYQDTIANRRADLSNRVQVRFSNSDEEATKSIDKDVMTDVTTQIANERSEAAVKLRDEGKADAARKMLEQNATYLNDSIGRLGLSPSAPATAALKKLEERNRQDAESVTGSEWNASRKSMREFQHKQKVQQAY